MLIKKPIPLGKWVPDNSFWNSSLLYECKNVIPQAVGYEPLPDLVSNESAISATLRARGAMTFRKSDAATETLAGIKTDIKHRQSDGTWTSIGDISFNTDAGSGFWSMTQYGDLAIMVNGADAPRKWDFTSTPVNTSALGGSPPTARYATTVYEFVVLGHLSTAPNKIHWSAINTPEAWTVGTNLSDVQEFPAGGRVMGLFGGERLLVLQERKIRLGVFAPGSPEIFQFDVISEDRGSIAYRGSAQIGDVVFFLANDGFYVIEGAGVTQISDELTAEWFFNNSDAELRSRTVCGIDAKKKMVMWAFFSTANGGSSFDEATPDKLILFHWPNRQWAHADIGFEAPVSVSAAALGLEDLDSINSSLDALTGSLDSGIYNTEVLGASFAAFTSANKLGELSGSNLQADLTLRRQQFAAPNRQIIDGIMVNTDASNYSVALGAYGDLAGDSPTVSSYISNEGNGWCPHHSSARMHDIRIRIPAAETWHYIQSVYANAEPDGEL